MISPLRSQQFCVAAKLPIEKCAIERIFQSYRPSDRLLQVHPRLIGAQLRLVHILIIAEQKLSQVREEADQLLAAWEKAGL